MKFTADDFLLLRAPLAIFLISVTIAVIIVHTGYQSLARTQDRLAQHEAALAQAREKLERSGEEKLLIEQYLPAFRALEQRGFIGTERRIDWLDALRNTGRELRLDGMDYQISPQQRFTGQLAIDTQPFELQQSVMKLSFKLLHEGDLMRLLNRLSDARVGVYLLDRCDMKRLSSPEAPILAGPNLAVDCQLRWLTLSAPPSGVQP